MNLQLSYHNIDKTAHAGLDKLTRELAERHLGHRLAKFHAELVHLEAHLEKSKHRSRYLVKLRLSVPGNTMTSSEESDDLAGTLRLAYAELQRELERYLEHLRREESWRRKERRELLRRLKTAVCDRPGAGVNAFGTSIRPLLPAVERLVRRELSYLRARGDMAPDFPSVQDLFDDVLARAYKTFEQRPDQTEARHWLQRIVLTVLGEEVARRRAEDGRFVSLETRAPEVPDETLDERDETLYEFWQPDELVRLENVVPGTAEDPEEAATRSETRAYLNKILAALPTTWRRAVLLAEVDDVPLASVARQLDATENQVKRWIEQANEFLRDRLEEVGLRPPASSQSANRMAPVESTSIPELQQVFDEIVGVQSNNGTPS